MPWVWVALAVCITQVVHTAAATPSRKGRVDATTAPNPNDGTNARQRPNIVIIQPDDLPYYWDDTAPALPPTLKLDVRPPTPHMDRIPDEGLVFSRGYVPVPCLLQCAVLQRPH